MQHSVIIDEEKIQSRIRELAQIISTDYKSKQPLLVGILKGAFMFMADLSRQIHEIHSVDFMAVSSYGSSTTSSGVVRILKDLDTPITNRHVIIVEDIIDSGLTLKYITNLLKARLPASLQVCALLDKKEKHPEEVLAKYIGFEIPDKFVIGFGLDYDQKYRNLPYISCLESGDVTHD